jgi:hypothetical protein
MQLDVREDMRQLHPDWASLNTDERHIRIQAYVKLIYSPDFRDAIVKLHDEVVKKS